MTDRLKIGQEVLIHGYVDDIRKDTIIIQNDGGYFGTVECEVTDIEMSDTNEMLDKIKDEIENHCGLIKENHCKYCSYCNSVMGVREILEIIDKYIREDSDVDAKQKSIDDKI